MKTQRYSPIVLFVLLILPPILVCSCLGPRGNASHDAPPPPGESSGWTLTTDPDLMNAMQGGGRTTLVLVGVGTHENDRNFNLDYMSGTVEDVKAAFIRLGLNYDKDSSENTDIHLLTGSNAVADKIRKAIMAAAPNTDRDRLIFYYIGHGFTLDGARRCFFTHETSCNGKTAEDYLSEAQLTRWLSEAKGDTKATILAVLDCCYNRLGVNESLPETAAPGDMDLTPQGLADVVIAPCGPGGTAYEDKGINRSLLSDRFAKAMMSYADKGHGTLQEVVSQAFKEVRDYYAENKCGEKPVISSESIDFTFVGQGNLSCIFTVFDALTGHDIDGAEIHIEDSVHPAPFPAHHLVDGEYQIKASAEGYFLKVENVKVNRNQSGKTYRCALYPEYVAFTGTVKRSDGSVPGGVRVSASGPHRDLRDCFRYETSLDDEGGFTLRVPVTEHYSGVVLRGPGAEPIEARAESYDVITEEGNRIRRYSLGVIRFDTAADSADTRFEDPRGEEFFRTAMEYKKSGRFELADAAFLDSLDFAGDEATRTWLIRCRIDLFQEEAMRRLTRRSWQSCFDFCQDAATTFPEEELFTEIGFKADCENIPESCRSAYTEAVDFLAAGELEKAEYRYETAWEEANDYYKKLIADGLGKCYRELRNRFLSDAIRHYNKGQGKEAYIALLKLKKYQKLSRLHKTYETKLAASELSRDQDIQALMNTERKRIDLGDYASKALSEFSFGKTVEGFTYLREETFSCNGETNTVKIYRHEKTGLEFVLVPGGSFMMGSEDGDDDEEPVHRVTVKPFLLCRTECTQAAWDRIGGEDSRHWNGDDLPIEGVNWNDCTAWCRKGGLAFALGGGMGVCLSVGDDIRILLWCRGRAGCLRVERRQFRRPDSRGG